MKVGLAAESVDERALTRNAAPDDSSSPEAGSAWLSTLGRSQAALDSRVGSQQSRVGSQQSSDADSTADPEIEGEEAERDIDRSETVGVARSETVDAARSETVDVDITHLGKTSELVIRQVIGWSRLRRDATRIEGKEADAAAEVAAPALSTAYAPTTAALTRASSELSARQSSVPSDPSLATAPFLESTDLASANSTDVKATGVVRRAPDGTDSTESTRALPEPAPSPREREARPDVRSFARTGRYELTAQRTPSPTDTGNSPAARLPTSAASAHTGPTPSAAQGLGSPGVAPPNSRGAPTSPPHPEATAQVPVQQIPANTVASDRGAPPVATESAVESESASSRASARVDAGTPSRSRELESESESHADAHGGPDSGTESKSDSDTSSSRVLTKTSSERASTTAHLDGRSSSPVMTSPNPAQSVAKPLAPAPESSSPLTDPALLRQLHDADSHWWVETANPVQGAVKEATVHVNDSRLGALSVLVRSDHGAVDLEMRSPVLATTIALRSSESALRASFTASGRELRNLRVITKRVKRVDEE